MEHKLLKSKEVAEILRIKNGTIRKWIFEERIPVIRIGGCVFIKRETVDKILDQGL